MWGLLLLLSAKVSRDGQEHLQSLLLRNVRFARASVIEKPQGHISVCKGAAACDLIASRSNSLAGSMRLVMSCFGNGAARKESCTQTEGALKKRTAIRHGKSSGNTVRRRVLASLATERCAEIQTERNKATHSYQRHRVGEEGSLN
jgi:hypothetical protein